MIFFIHYHKEFGVSPLILYNLTGFVIKALWKPLFYGERPGIVLNVIIQLLSCICLFATPWATTHQASLSFTVSQSLCKLMSSELVMPSSHLILCRPLLLLPSIFPIFRVFSNESALHIRWPSIGASASASVLPMNIQG